MVDELRSANPANDVQATYAVVGSLRCNSGRIGQLVSNLLGNALRHGDASEPIRLYAVTRNDGVFCLWVANGGTPIPRDAMETLLHPFVHGQPSGTADDLGLGLYIAQEIAKAYEGNLTVTSTDDETRFAFEMPGLVNCDQRS